MKLKANHLKRLISFLLCLIMVFICLPLTALAVEAEESFVEDVSYYLNGVKQENGGFVVNEGDTIELQAKLNVEYYADINPNFSFNLIKEDGSGFYFFADVMGYDEESGLYTSVLSNQNIGDCEFVLEAISYHDADDKLFNTNCDVNGNYFDENSFYFGSVVNFTNKPYLEIQAPWTYFNSEVTLPRVITLNMLEELANIDLYPEDLGVEISGWNIDFCGSNVAVTDADKPIVLYDGNNYDSFFTITISPIIEEPVVWASYVDYNEETGENDLKYYARILNDGEVLTYGQFYEEIMASGVLDNAGYDTSGYTDYKVYWDYYYNENDEIPEGNVMQLQCNILQPDVYIGGKALHQYCYMDNKGNVTEEKPVGGYAYNGEFRLVLNNFRPEFVEVGSGIEINSYDLTDIMVIGDNRIVSADSDVLNYRNEEYYDDLYDPNLNIMGAGSLELVTYGDADGIDIMDFGLKLMGPDVKISSGDHGIEMDDYGNLYVYAGDISISCGDEGFDVEEDIRIYGGNISITARDQAIDSGENIYIYGGELTLTTLEDDAIESDYSIVINGGSIDITSAEDGIACEGELKINGGTFDIDSDCCALFAYEGITLSEDYVGYEIEKVDGYYYLMEGEDVAEDAYIVKAAKGKTVLTGSCIELSETKAAYNGKNHKPTIKVYDPETGKLLVNGEDYLVSYSSKNFTEIGKYQIKIMGEGDYTGVRMYSFEVYDGSAIVGGVKLQPGEYLANGSTQPVTTKPASGGYAYLKEDRVLELNNFTIKDKVHNFTYNGYESKSVIYSENDLEIVLKGKNTIVNTSDNTDGISVINGDLTISGTGSVDITADYAINVNGLVMIDGGTIDITAEYGIYATESVDIGDGDININAAEHGIFADYDIYFYGGKLNIKSLNNGVYASYFQVYKGAELNIEAGKYGVDCSSFILNGAAAIKADIGLYIGQMAYIDFGALAVIAETAVIDNGKLNTYSNMKMIAPEGGYNDNVLTNADGTIATKVVFVDESVLGSALDVDSAKQLDVIKRTMEFCLDNASTYSETELKAINDYLAAINGRYNEVSKYEEVKNVKVTSVNSSTVKITWDKVEGAVGYEVYRALKEDGNYSVIYETDNPDKVSLNNYNRITGKPYYYYVRALFDDDGVVVRGRIHDPVSGSAVPVKPNNLKVASLNATQLKISWNKVTGATGYKVYSSTTGKTGTFNLIYTTTNPDKLSVTHSNRTTGKTYYYKVRAIANYNGSVINGTLSAAATGKAIPATPVVTISKASATSIRNKWNAVAKADGYEVYRSLTGKSGTFYLQKRTEYLSYANTALTKGKTYYYKVRAYTLVNGARVYGKFSSVKSYTL